MLKSNFDINEIIGLRLARIYYSSFYIKNELVELYNVIYLCFEKENCCIHCSISDDEIFLRKINKLKIITHNEIIDDFKYPIEKLSIPTNFLNKKLTNIIEIKNDYLGIKFIFENFYLLYYEKKEKLYIDFKKII